MLKPKDSLPPLSDADKRTLRQALGQFATGVTIITARTASGEDIGITANSFASVSLDPPMILWSLARNSQNVGEFRPGFRFAVNVLARGHEPLARHFGRSGADQFSILPVDSHILHGLGDVPLIGGAIACFECRVDQTVEAGDHNVLIATVDRFAQAPGEPLVFHGGRFMGVDPAA